MTGNAAVNPIKLIEELAEFTWDPLGCVKAVFNWGIGDLADSVGPRIWQTQILQDIGTHLQNLSTRYQPLQIAVASGHDIGKSALVSMIVKWGLSTCEDCRIMITANTGNQLASKTQPEVAKWFRAAEDSFLWDVKATRIDSLDPAHKATWRADFETWSENNTEAFQGLHNKRKRIVVIFDEASGIPKPIWEAVAGVMLDEDTEIIFLAFGNPTKNTGDFRECFGSQKHRWKTYQIDSRTVEGTNKTQIEKWIQDYGEDSDFVRVRVRGEFPRAGSSQFISAEAVSNARRFRAEGYTSLPKVLSVDVARFGDDQTVIGTRQGRKFVILAKYRGLDNAEVGDRVIEFIQKEKPDATVIDADGMGTGVYDHIKYRGFTDRLFEFHGGFPASDGATYFNKRSECWGLLRDWINAEAEIPDDPELESDLTGPEYGFSNKGAIQLERKEDMKARGLSSPDCGDCLAMTFGVKVAPPPPKPEIEYRYPGEGSLSWMGG